MRNKKKNNNVSIVTTPSVFNVYLGADNRQLNGAGFFFGPISSSTQISSPLYLSRIAIL